VDDLEHELHDPLLERLLAADALDHQVAGNPTPAEEHRLTAALHLETTPRPTEEIV
jgi:hypothetical protein